MISAPALANRLLAGATFGAVIAHLVQLLNPQIDVSVADTIAAYLSYGLICSFVAGVPLVLLHLLAGRATVHDPGSGTGSGWIAAAAFAAAATVWMHAYVLRIYLPRSAVRALANAAIVTGLAGFALMTIWLLSRSLRERRPSLESAAAAALVVLTLAILHARRDAYVNVTRTTAAPPAITAPPRQPVIVVGVRGLPYDWMLTLEGEGAMPQLSRLRKESFVSRVQPFPSTSSAAVWASLTTGKLPHRHGVTGRFAYETLLNRRGEPLLTLPLGIGFRRWGLIPPVRRLAARLPAGRSAPFWRMFNAAGRETSIISWPGVAAPGLQTPPARDARSTRFDAAVSHAVANDEARTRAAREAIQKRQPLVVVALEGLGTIADALRLRTNVLPERGSEAGEAIRVYCDALDRLIGELAASTPRNATIVIVSPTAVRVPTIPRTPLAIAGAFLVDAEDEGADEGILLIRGAGITPRELHDPVEVVDVVPTVLLDSGLPLARDLDGRPLLEALDRATAAARPLVFIQTYETAPGHQRSSH